MKSNTRNFLSFALFLAVIVGVAPSTHAAAAAPKAKKQRPDANADVWGETGARPGQSMVFKTPHMIYVRYFPKDWKASDQRPGIVFVRGGFVGGSLSQFYAKEYLASRGLVCICAEYR